RIHLGVISMETSHIRKRMPVSALADPKIVLPAIGSAFVKLDPRTLIKSPIMFEVQIIVWLWFTVLFANFAEAIAEGLGKAQAESLRRQRTETQAKLLTGPD